ncbi:MAG: L,D-transpeptidase family protein [Anaerolineae bacterium]|nr:L,D-transpeptidase family protein [Anaerolineae bacterium]
MIRQRRSHAPQSSGPVRVPPHLQRRRTPAPARVIQPRPLVYGRQSSPLRSNVNDRSAAGYVHGAAPARRRPPRARQQRRWLLWGVAVPLAVIPALLIMSVVLLGLGLTLAYAGRVFPQVMVAGVPVGGLTQAEAAQTLSHAWGTVLLRDGERVWPVEATALGVTLDTEATAARALAHGRGRGGRLDGLLRPSNIGPVLVIDESVARAGLTSLAPQVALAPVNAGVRLVNGRVEPTPPREGRALDVEATLQRLRTDGALADGTLALVMQPVAPEVVDATPLVTAAERLLSQPLDIRLYDPVTGDIVHWTLPPEQWGAWLVAVPDPGQPIGLALSLQEGALGDYLHGQAAAALDASRYLKIEEVVAAVQAGLANGQPAADARVYHHDRQHTVQPGETLISIAWDYGVPYPWIQQANGDLTGVSAGQTITIPSPDTFLEFPVVADKRIEVSISQQRVRVYEGGALLWDWPASTGIADSPTWPGIYQIISHVPNAYAANWNLYMPYFLGVYRPIPGADFTNGFHGFPTRGGSQLLWTNSLGHRVTYGCILISTRNAELLYNWAQEGVVVEITP